jgi:hypothetical protein
VEYLSIVHPRYQPLSVYSSWQTERPLLAPPPRELPMYLCTKNPRRVFSEEKLALRILKGLHKNMLDSTSRRSYQSPI